MKTTPILFTGPMVRAILDERKTQTRRLIDPQPELVPDESLFGRARGSYWWASRAARSMMDLADIRSLSPYGSSGDRLWVRETWGVVEPHPSSIDDYIVPGMRKWQGVDFDEMEPDTQAFYRRRIAYQATEPDADVRVVVKGEPVRRWHPSIFMPRWACRITLDVTGVRVERLHDISAADAKAEGAPPNHPSIDAVSREFGYADFSRSWFAQTWDSINSKRAPWSSNPWVWVITFKRGEP